MMKKRGIEFTRSALARMQKADPVNRKNPENAILQRMSQMGNRKQIKALPFKWYFGSIVLLATAGWLDSLYLSISHYRVYTDMAYRSFCAISRAINCDTVSQSKYSILMGVPVPVWGVLGYSLFLALVLGGPNTKLERKKKLNLLFVLAVVFSIYSIVLALISTFLIHSYCIMCILSYGINFGLTYMVWLAGKRMSHGSGMIAGAEQHPKIHWFVKGYSARILSGWALIALAVIVFFPAYWHFTPPALSDTIATGVTREGYPWIGAENPELEITEFADYQCFQCKKMHFFLRELIQQYPNKIRLIHRQFPMDNQFNPLVKDAFHVGSAKMSLLAEYAKTKGKFWQMNDLLFEMAGKDRFVSTRTIAEKTGLDGKSLALSPKIPVLRYMLKHDIAIGISLGITGTPGFVIEGKVYQGQIPPEIIERVVG